MILLLIITFTVLGSIGSVLVASLFLLFPKPIRESVVPCLISYATGALLGTAFLCLLPEAMESFEISTVLGTVLVGIIIFFVLEKLIIWRHCHKKECEIHTQAGILILIGDAFHNFVDGLIIAGAFLNSVTLGIASSIAIIGHEIPQEVGDFAILINSGYSRRKALLYNLLSSLASLVAAIGGYFVFGRIEAMIPYIMAIATASFIYIALGDLIPGLQEKIGLYATVMQVILMLSGIATILLLPSHHH